MEKKIVEDLLKKAFVEKKQRMEIGYKHPKDFDACWEIIEDGYNFIISECNDLLGMYEFCILASKEYHRYHVIGADNAFSSVICELGIQPQSIDWYRIMAYHYERIADQLEEELIER